MCPTGDALSKAARKAAKAERKAAKKARKAAKAAAAAAAAGSAGGDPHAAPSKKRKTVDGHAAGGGSAPPTPGAPAPHRQRTAAAPGAGDRRRPAVGDAAAAAAGPPLVRDLYTVHPAVAATTDADVDAWRAERRIALDPGDAAAAAAPAALRPVTAFDHAAFAPPLAAALASFVAPSPIQAQCWPLLLGGHDLVGIAATGSGKTLAFGLPALAHVAAQAAARAAAGGPRGPGALVLAPTRELAAQIADVLAPVGAAAGHAVALAHGGVPKGPQVAALRRGAAVAVGTPGRLQDLADGGALPLGGVSFLVLDEADRMLDLGFEPAVRALAAATRADRQTAMFSATWPAAVRGLAADFMGGAPARVTVGSADLAASHAVAQTVEVIDPRARDARLPAVLAKVAPGDARAIVFVLYKKEAPRVEALLKRSRVAALAVHGDATQAARTAAVDAFRAGRVKVLVATDVAARGLDIPDVAAVVNYSFPLTVEDYVHRVGRTGRAGRTGVAHTFFCAAADRARAGELINVLREAGQPVPADLLKFGATVKRKESKLYGAHFREVGPGEPTAPTKVTFDSDDDE